MFELYFYEKFTVGTFLHRYVLCCLSFLALLLS